MPKKLKLLFETYEIKRFSDFSPNPRIEDLTRGKSFTKSFNPDLILAIGGGSVMDMAKLLKACLNQPTSNIENIIKGKIKLSDNKIPLFTIPTTAGSGSDATSFAVCYIKKAKYSVMHDFLRPSAVFLDGKLIEHLPRIIKIHSSLDAIAQAIESSWAKGGNNTSRRYAFDALAKAWPVVSKFVSEPFNENIYQTMLESAHLAGKAINISKTTAAHAWSYRFTKSHNIAHGHAIWLTLPKLFQIHQDNTLRSEASDNLKKVMKKLSGILKYKKKSECENKLKEFLASIHVESEMEKIGVDTIEKKYEIIESVNLQRLENNPVKLTDDDLKNVFNL